MDENTNIYYCGKTGDPELPYDALFESAYQVRMCGFSNEDIIKIRLEETEDSDSRGVYWGFKDLQLNELTLVFPSKKHLLMCSPDSFKSEIEEGTGKVVKLKVIELPKR